MNNLSVLLYLAGLSEGIAIVTTLVSIFIVIGSAVCCAIVKAEGGSLPQVRGYIIASIAALFAACFLPSKSTVYMIAASEAGERIAATPEAREMLDLVRLRLKKALSEDGK